MVDYEVPLENKEGSKNKRVVYNKINKTISNFLIFSKKIVSIKLLRGNDQKFFFLGFWRFLRDFGHNTFT